MSRQTRRTTRQSLAPVSDEKENSDLNAEILTEVQKTPRRKKRPAKNPDETDASPPKGTRSDSGSSLSPIAEKMREKLIINSPKSENKFRKARQALCTTSTSLPGREKEIQELVDFFNEVIDEKKSGSIYISGSPGTGKSASITKIINSSDFIKKLTTVYVNCTSISSIGSIYRKICGELNIKPSGGKTERDYSIAVEEFLTKKHNKTVMLVLDEIDQLMGKKQTILYRIFEWPALPNTRMILVGIANALDLTDRSLSRLQTKCELKPKLMHFPPYTKQQIVEIFTKRLEESNASDLFPPMSIQLLAAKVSAVSGDIRRALNIGNRVIEIAEAEKRRNIKELDMKKIESAFNEEQKTKENSSPEEQETKESDSAAQALPPPDLSSGKVQIKEVLSVLNNVYGTSQLDEGLDESFPLQQKILICTMLLIIKHDKNKDITTGRLQDIYRKICKNLNVVPADQSEFMNLCSLAETRGIIRIQKKKEPRFHRLFLEWDENEVWDALKDKQMITNILNNKTVLSNKK